MMCSFNAANSLAVLQLPQLMRLRDFATAREGPSPESPFISFRSANIRARSLGT